MGKHKDNGGFFEVYKRSRLVKNTQDTDREKPVREDIQKSSFTIEKARYEYKFGNKSDVKVLLSFNSLVVFFVVFFALCLLFFALGSLFGPGQAGLGPTRSGEAAPATAQSDEGEVDLAEVLPPVEVSQPPDASRYASGGDFSVRVGTYGADYDISDILDWFAIKKIPTSVRRTGNYKILYAGIFAREDSPEANKVLNEIKSFDRNNDGQPDWVDATIVRVQ